MRLRFPREEFGKLMEDFRRAYEEVSGREISYEEVLEILKGKKMLFPATERLVKILEELNHLYHIAPWEAKKWVRNPTSRNKR